MKLQEKTLLNLSLFLSFFLPLLYKGGIGRLNHLMFFFFIGIAGIIFISSKKNKDQIKNFPLIENILLISFIILLTLSYIFSQTKNVGLLDLGSVYAGFILIFIGYGFSKDQKHLNKFLEIINLGLVFGVTMGFLLYFVEPFERFSGTFNNYLEPWSKFPNAFGDFALLTLPIMWFFIEKKHTTLKVFFPFTVAAIYLTQSEGVYIAAAGLFILMLIRAFLTKVGVKKLIVLTLIGLAIGIGAQQIKNYRFENNINEEVIEDLEQQTSVNTRIEHFKISYELSKAAPGFGYGPESYNYISRPHLSLLNTADHPHNIFLKLAVENGLITALTFLAFLIILIVRKLDKYVKNEKNSLHSLILIGILGFFAHQLIDYNLQFTTITFLTFLFLGILVENGKSKIQKYNKIILASLAIVLTLFSIHEGLLIVASKLQKNPNKSFELQEKMFIKQDFYTRLTEYKLFSGATFEEGSKVIEKGLALNKHDADLYSFKNDFKTAYKLNPHRLRNLLGLFEISSEQEKEILKPIIKTVLENYLSLLKNNANFTILTENPAFALSLANAIKDQQLLEELETTKVQETKKFAELYNIKPEDIGARI